MPVPSSVMVLAHSPLTGPAAWGRLPEVLRDRGHETVVVEVIDDVAPPYAGRYVARAALQVAAGVPSGRPVVLVGHSGAGYLLPQIGAARKAARAPVAAYVFLDAGIPHGRGATRSTLLRGEDRSFADDLDALLAAGGAFPTWDDDDLRDLVPDDELRGALVRSLRPRGQDFFTEPLPFPADWPDAPCGFVRLSAAYERPARVARSRGWLVVVADVAGGHFAMCTDPGGVADALEELFGAL